MADIESQIKTLKDLIPKFLPGHSVDCVIFGYEEKELKVLLLNWKQMDLWALPGGFIFKDESMDDAAQRVLEERTGLSSIFLKQFHTFGKIKRSDHSQQEHHKKIMALMKPNKQDQQIFIDWFDHRFITTGYFALTDIGKATPRPDFLSDRCEWKNVSELPELIIDHAEIIQQAMHQLKIQLNYLPIGISLLPEKFTMIDLQKLYEAILGRSLERSNFQRKILKIGFLDRHEKLMSGAANKAPYLYSFNSSKYEQLLEEGIGFRY
ncbi:NUDIX hydrolase [Flagellimonas sp.]|uniref:NUDIX hydrolase n=1 Tax=Flagellimonas sp. TaxID=2058762 RepID=UPI003B5288D3